MSDFEEVEEPAPKLRSKRIFINNVDSYTGKNLSQVTHVSLLTCLMVMMSYA